MSKVLTPEFRVAFPNVFQARLNKLNKKMEFSLVALFKKGENLDKLKAACIEAASEKFGRDQKKWPKKFRMPFRDQGERGKTNDAGNVTLPKGYEAGAVFLNLKSNQKPGVVDQQVQDIIDQSEFYAGCWAQATLNPYAYDTAGNFGVAFGLGNVQKVRDDDHFGNRTKPQEDFAPITDSVDAQSADSASKLFEM